VDSLEKITPGEGGCLALILLIVVVIAINYLMSLLGISPP